MPRRGPVTPSTVALRIALDDTPDAIPALLARVGAAGGTLRTLSTVRRIDAAEAPDAGTASAASAGSTVSAGSTAAASPAGAELEIEVEGIDEERLIRAIHGLPGLRAQRFTKSLERVFGKRVIVIGGGAQVAQVALGAVSEADRHNLRGERISVDTIALVGEENIAAAVRAVADLPRARMLVLAGSIMGGDITRAARELREHGIPIIALNMVGSITEAVDLVVSDPVQAGTMAVMAVADTAAFDIARQRGRRY
jgi:energy-converting hydrogenase B subunit Q